jgi:signal transduction histidine kinase
VVLSSLAVLAVVLLVVGVLAEVFVGVQSRADLTARLTERTTLAGQLAGQGLTPDELVDRLDGQGIRVRLVTAGGVSYGAGEGRPGRGRWGPPPGSLVRRVQVDGSRVMLFADAGELTAVQRRLSRVLVLLGVAGLVAAALALLATTRVALAPLDAMTALARSITAGGRGRRLAPNRADTELGRTARAFDDMLDALEGAERQAKDAEATARASEERTRQFVADAAHELRTPIAGLRAAAEAALSVRASGEERERLQMLLIREAGRAGRLVEDLLAMARIDAGLRLDRQPVALAELATAEVERVRLLAPGLTVTVRRDDGPPVVVPGDAGRLAQVLANLLGNARRHTPDGGAVTVTVGRTDTEATVTVADTGPGVPPAERERIFDRLVRLDDARVRDGVSPGSAGAGLGLAIARGIARAHGGDLRCGADSVFELTLPLHPPAADAPALPRPPAEQPPAEPPRPDEHARSEP